MNKFLALLVICFLCTVSQVAYAERGGEHNNTHCNGVGNVNSPCDGSEIIDNPPPPPPVDECEEPPVVPPLQLTCTVPTVAAGNYLSSEFEFSNVPRLCAKQCRAVTNACKAAVEGQAKCYDGLIKGARAFTLQNCAAIADVVERKACSETVRDYAKGSTNVLADNFSVATHLCADAYDVCVAACGS